METFLAFLQKYVDKAGTFVYSCLVPEMGTRKGGENMVNEAKLRGRIAEKGFTLSSLADAVKMSRQTLRMKITNKIEFRASEIEAIRVVLDIPYEEIHLYFFYHECPQIGNIAAATA